MMRTNVQPVFDTVLVEVEREWNGEIQTESGVVGIAFENDLDRSVGAQRKGRVVRVPRQISNHHYLSLINTEVREGDILYFHFNSILEDTRVQLDAFERPHYLVHMENIFAIIRDGAIIMFGDRVLCEPIFDDDVVTLEDGLRVKKSESGIITDVNIGHNMKRARIAHIGSGLNDRKSVDAMVGDIIFYDVDADFENEIEGRKYFCMLQDDLLMREI
jgi:co-chaperonin GroES (HSP10)